MAFRIIIIIIIKIIIIGIYIALMSYVQGGFKLRRGVGMGNGNNIKSFRGSKTDGEFK